MHMDDSGVMRHLYRGKKDARKATLLGIIQFEKPHTDALDYRRMFGEKHGVMSRPYTLFRDQYNQRELFILQRKTMVTCEIVNVFPSRMDGNEAGFTMHSKHFYRLR
jgi:hypothetical protein